MKGKGEGVEAGWEGRMGGGGEDRGDGREERVKHKNKAGEKGLMKER